MKTWIDRKSVCENYWFDTETSKQLTSNLSYLKSVNLIGDNAFTKGDKKSFIEFAKVEVQKLLTTAQGNQYRCYLLCRRILLNKSSKVENYKKIWKYLDKEYNIENCKYSMEMKIDSNEDTYYCSIIEMELKDIDFAIEIACSKASRFAIFISKNKDNLSEENLRLLASIAYKYSRKSVNDINITELCIHLAERGDIGIRWADDSTGFELDLIFNSKFIKGIQC